MGDPLLTYSVDPDDSLTIKQNLIRMHGTFDNISYNIFKSSILPIISENPADAHKTLYEDPRLPMGFKDKVRAYERTVESEVNFVTLIGIWIGYKIPINLILKGNIFNGVGLFNKWVLGLTVPTWVFGFQYAKEFVSGLDFFDVEELMFVDRKNSFVSMYRKRLVESHPDYARKIYMNDFKLMSFDGVNPMIFNSAEVKEKMEKKESEMDDEEELTASQLEYLQAMEIEKGQKGNS